MFLTQNGMRGLGGVDFLFENNQAWLVDVNLGRPTAHIRHGLLEILTLVPSREWLLLL